jgi:hypothetical protein
MEGCETLYLIAVFATSYIAAIDKPQQHAKRFEQRWRHDVPISFIIIRQLSSCSDIFYPCIRSLTYNYLSTAAKAFEGKENEEIWFGLEQEFTLFNLDQRTPLGWPKNGVPNRPQGPYYCSAGPENSFGRAVTDAHYRACLYAGIDISGTNGEVRLTPTKTIDS